MTLHLMKGPAPSLALRRGEMPSGFMEKLRNRTDAALELSRPQPIYTASTVAFLKRTVLKSARLSGWQYILLSGERAIGTIEVRSLREQPSYAGVYEGPHAGWLIEALLMAERLPAIRKRDYEVRILRAPTVALLAVWLRSERQDLLIPAGRLSEPLHANHVYTELEVTNALRSLAVQHATVSDAETEIAP